MLSFSFSRWVAVAGVGIEVVGAVEGAREVEEEGKGAVFGARSIMLGLSVA